MQPRPEGSIPNYTRPGTPTGVDVWWVVPPSTQLHPLSPSSSEEEGAHDASGPAFPSSPLLQERENNGVSWIGDRSIAAPVIIRSNVGTEST